MTKDHESQPFWRDCEGHRAAKLLLGVQVEDYLVLKKRIAELEEENAKLQQLCDSSRKHIEQLSKPFPGQ